MCVCVCFLPNKVVIAYQHEVLQDGQEVGFGRAVLDQAVNHVEHVTHITAALLRSTHTHTHTQSKYTRDSKESPNEMEGQVASVIENKSQ